MIEHGNTILSADIKEKQFVCDLEKCKGVCCVEGDLGAPLEVDELKTLEEIYDVVQPYMDKKGIEAVKKEGLYIYDEDGEYSTTTINGKECVFAFYEDTGILKCAIEQAHLDGKTDFKKPISCHLYPIRVTKYEEFDALNYDQWHICSDACTLGEKLGVEVYKFLKEPLIRKYGVEWYNELLTIIEEEKNLPK